MSIFVKIVKGYTSLTIFAKSSIADVCVGSKYASVNITLQTLLEEHSLYKVDEIFKVLPKEK